MFARIITHPPYSSYQSYLSCISRTSLGSLGNFDVKLQLSHATIVKAYRY